MKVPAAVVEARREALADRIANEGYLSLSELCRRMGVSVATARRDLSYLQSRGRISRVRGGALARDRRAAVPDPASDGRSLPKVRGDTDRDLYTSPAAQALKESICEAGRRAWRRGLVEGACGNFSARFGNHVLCTPAGAALGFLNEETICMVDMDGRQTAGLRHWRSSPEVLVDLAVYRAVPSAAAVVHAHPVHATAFGISGLEPPRGLLAEFEVLAGPLAIAEYRTPGSPELASLVAELAPNHQAILLCNHGVVCWGTSIEDAYLKLEMTETYCQTVAVAGRLSDRITLIPAEKLACLLEEKVRVGISHSGATA